MVLDCLLVSGDPEVTRVLQPTLQELSIRLRVCDAADSGQQILAKEKFDAVIVDCDDLANGRSVLQSIRRQPSNKNSVAFAILNGKTTATQSFDMGSNFVLQKPIQPLNARRCFSAAVGLMIRERRRYYRVPVSILVMFKLKTGKQLVLKATNLSEGGMALESAGQLRSQSDLEVEFTLPDSSTTLRTEAELAWADGSGQVGVRFMGMDPACRDNLARWVTVQMAALEPSPVQ